MFSSEIFLLLVDFAKPLSWELPAGEILAIALYAKAFSENGGDSGPSFELAVEHFMIKKLVPAAGFRETTVLGVSARKKGKKQLSTSQCAALQAVLL